VPSGRHHRPAPGRDAGEEGDRELQPGARARRSAARDTARRPLFEFLDRFISIAVPRMRDFRGLPTKSFDGRGNYTLSIKEQMDFSRDRYVQSRAHSRDG